jgi:hypothetical protein
MGEGVTSGRRAVGLFVVGAILGLGPAAIAVDAPPALTRAEAERLVHGVTARVEELRGLAFKQPVAVEVIGDDAAREYMLRRFKEFQGEEDLRWEQKALYLLGVLDEEVDVLKAYLGFLREQVGGFYDPEGKAFYLLDDMPRAFLTRLAIPHELTHALDDQHFDLDTLIRDAIEDDDLMFARAAVHEGSATLLMQLHVMKGMLAGEVDGDDLSELAEADAAWGEQLEDFPAPLLRPLLGSYLLGASFLTRGNLLSLAVDGFPVDAVNQAFLEGPRSSEQVLHPEKYWDAEQRDEPTTVDLGDAGRVLGGRYELRAEGVLGELMIGSIVGAPTPSDPGDPTAMSGSAWTNAAAAGWDGDRWQIWSDGRKSVALLGTVWDSEADAREFAEALSARSRLTARTCEERVAVVSGASGRKRARVLERALSELGCVAD